jgi:hypothetical protein
MSLLVGTERIFKKADCAISIGPIVKVPITICTEVTQADTKVMPASELLQIQGLLLI